ncbi:hypothetical protein J6590_000100 [Homalodisca vitripennis]|nr:hypothetical protein J6590_000100 [Homalodisca vitripennis]
MGCLIERWERLWIDRYKAARIQLRESDPCFGRGEWERACPVGVLHLGDDPLVPHPVAKLCKLLSLKVAIAENFTTCTFVSQAYFLNNVWPPPSTYLFYPRTSSCCSPCIVCTLASPGSTALHLEYCTVVHIQIYL